MKPDLITLRQSDKQEVNEEIKIWCLANNLPYEVANKQYFSIIIKKAFELGSTYGQRVRFDIDDNTFIGGDGIRKGLPGTHQECLIF